MLPGAQQRGEATTMCKDDTARTAAESKARAEVTRLTSEEKAVRALRDIKTATETGSQAATVEEAQHHSRREAPPVRFR